MSVRNENIIEISEQEEIFQREGLREFLNHTDEKWKKEKPLYFATRNLIQEFWKYIHSLFDSQSNPEESFYEIQPFQNIQEKLIQEKSNIKLKFKELCEKRKNFIKSKISNEPDFNEEISNKKIDFYFNKIYNEEIINETFIKELEEYEAENSLCKNNFDLILIFIIKEYVKNSIPFLRSNMTLGNELNPQIQDVKLLEEILIDINAFREVLKYRKYSSDQQQLEFYFILFLLKNYKFLKNKIADKFNSTERNNIKIINSNIKNNNNIDKEKERKNFISNLQSYHIVYNIQEIYKKLMLLFIEDNRFSLLKIIKHSDGEDRVIGILKNEFEDANFTELKTAVIPTLEDLIRRMNNSNINNNNSYCFELSENNLSIKTFVRVFKIFEIIKSENPKILFETYHQTYRFSFRIHQENNNRLGNSIRIFGELDMNMVADNNNILKKLILYLDTMMIEKINPIFNQNSGIFQNTLLESAFDASIVNQIPNPDQRDDVYLKSDPNNIDLEMEILVEKFRFDNKPEGSFIRLLTELINILENVNKKTENLDKAKRYNYTKNQIQYIEGKKKIKIKEELKRRFNKQIKGSQEKEDLLDEALNHMNTDFYEALRTLRILFQKCEKININYLRFLISKTEQAAAKIKGKDIILLLGETGNGKSTLTLFLSGVKLIRNEDGEVVAEPQNYENPELYNVKPRSGSTSETRYLTAIENSSEKLGNTDFSRQNKSYIICDSPGLEDTRDRETEISNNMGLLHGIVNCKSVRPVLVTTLDFGERMQGLVKLIKSIKGMLSSPAEDIPKFVFLANKCSVKRLDKFKTDFTVERERIIDKLRLEDNDKDLIQFFEKVFTIFNNRITAVNPVNDKFKDLLNKVILADMRPLTDLSSVFKLPYSESMENSIDDFIQVSKDSISLSVKTIEESFCRDEEKEFDKELLFEMSMINYHISNLNYFIEKIQREDFKEKLDLIIYDLEIFLYRNYQDQKKILDKSLQPENNFSEDELTNFIKSYKINKSFDGSLKKFFSENCILHEAYLSFLKNHFDNLLKMLSISEEEEIKCTNKILNKVEIIIKKYSQLENNILPNYDLEIKFIDMFGKRIITEFSNVKEKYENLFKEKKIEELFELQKKMCKVVSFFDEKGSGFFYAKNFFEKSPDYGNDLRIKIEADSEISKETIKLDRKTLIKELKDSIEDLRSFSFIRSKVDSLEKEILEIFDLTEIFDGKLKKFEDDDIDKINSTLHILEKLKGERLGDINKIAYEAFVKIGETVKEYLNFLNNVIDKILKGKRYIEYSDNSLSDNEKQNEMQNKNNKNSNSNVRRTNSISLDPLTNFSGPKVRGWDDSKSEIIFLYLDLQDFFHNIAKIGTIEILSNYTIKPIMESYMSLDNFLLLFGKNVKEIYENIKMEFTSDFQLKCNCNRLKNDMQIISNSKFLMERKKDFLEDLKLNFAKAIINFLDGNEYFGILKLNESSIKKQERALASIYAVNSLNILLNLKDYFPELSKLQTKIDCFYSLCEKILKDIKETFSEEKMGLKESLKKKKTIEYLELCENFEKLNTVNPYYNKFKEAKDQIENFLKAFYAQIIQPSKDSFFEEINKFELSNYLDHRKIEELKIKLGDWLFAFNEFKIIQDKYKSLLQYFSEEEDYESLWDQITSTLKEKIVDPISKHLEEGINIKHEVIDVIPKIIGIFEKFETTFKLNTNFTSIKDGHRNLLSFKIPDEIKSGMNRIDERKYEEILKYLDDISKENFQETKKNIYMQLKTHLAKNLHELIQANEISLNKLRNSEYDSCEIYLSEISEHLKCFKQIKGVSETINIYNHIEKDKYNRILEQYDNSMRELNGIFEKISEYIKVDIDNFNFKMYSEKKEFLSKNLNKFADFIERGTPLNEPFIESFKKLIENKIKEIVALYKESFDNFIRNPPKDLYLGLKDISAKDSESFISEIKNILNSYLSTIKEGNIIERDNTINKLKKHYLKYLPDRLKTEFEIICDDIQDNLAFEKEQNNSKLDQYMNNKQHQELIEFWKEMKNYDTEGRILIKLKEFISNELFSVKSKIEDSCHKNIFEDMYSYIPSFDKILNIYKESFAECTQPIFNQLRKFLETKLTKTSRYLINEFSPNYESSDLVLKFHWSDLNSDHSLDDSDTDSNRIEKAFSHHLSLFEKTLLFRKEQKDLYYIYIEKNSEFSFLNVLETITENIKTTIKSFEESILNNGLLDFANLSDSYSNILRWKNKINLFKIKILEEKNIRLSNNKNDTQDRYKPELFFHEDMENEIVENFLIVMRNFDADSFKKILDDSIDKIKSEILGFSFTQEPQNYQERLRENIFESLLVKMEVIEKLVNRKICEKSNLNEILSKIQDNIQRSFKRMLGIIGGINSQNQMIKDNDINQLSYIYENFKSFNSVCRKFFSQNNKELKIESHLIEVQHSLENIFNKITDDCFEKYSKSKSKFEKISEILITLKSYSNKLKFMQEPIDTLINSITDRTKKADKDNIAIKQLGDLLSSDPIGKNILEDYEVFSGYLEILNPQKQPKNLDIKEILDKLKAENVKLNTEKKIIGQNRLLDKKQLQEFYSSYSSFYEKYLNLSLSYQNKDKKFENLLGLLPIKINYNMRHKPEKTMWNYDMVTSLPEILAIISVIWTLLFSQHLNVTPQNRDDKYLIKPKANEILAIFCLFCVDIKTYDIFNNNLVETGMGESKSTVIALAAAILALYGFNVNILCYNTYLSKKYHGKYLPFFRILGVSYFIFYGDFNAIGQKIFNENGDLKEMATKLIFPEKNSSEIKISVGDNLRENGMSLQNLEEFTGSKAESEKEKSYQEESSGKEDSDNCVSNYRPNFLIIDDVDVLLSKSYYNTQFTPNFTYKHEKINALFDFIWKNRFKLLEIQKEGDSGLDNQEDRTKRCIAFRDELVQSSQYKNCLNLFSNYPEILTEIIKDILSDLVEFKSLPKYEIENDKIAYKDEETYIYNIRYRYKTVFAYYEEYTKKRISENSLKQNVHFIFNCGNFSFPEIFKGFRHVIGVNETLTHLNEIEKEILGGQYKILRYVFIPNATGGNGLNLNNKFDDKNIFIAENKQLQFKEIVNKISNLFNTYSKLYLPTENQMGDKKLSGDNINKKAIDGRSLKDFSVFNNETERCIIIFFENLQDLSCFMNSYYFNALNRPYVVLSEKTPKEAIEYTVRHACKSGSITLVTKAFARGLDLIVRDEAVIAAGGLLVIQSFLSEEKSEEMHIASYATTKNETGEYNIILNNEQLEAIKFPLSKIKSVDLKDGSLFNLIDVHRRKIYDAHLTACLQDHLANKETHNESSEFVKILKNGETSKAREYILKFNKGMELGGKYVCRTKIFLDATLSMDELINIVKSIIGNIFSRSYEILKSQNIQDRLISIQICAYRNYNCCEDLILESSPWESKSDNLISFLNKVRCIGGWGNEAIEIALWDILQAQPHIAQAIIIGDRRGNTQEEIEFKRGNSGSFKGDYNHPAEYWSKSKYGKVKACETMIGDIENKNIKLHGFFIVNQELTEEKRESTRIFFEDISTKTNGVSHPIDLENKNSKETLTRYIVWEILRDIAQNSGLETMEKKLLKEYDYKYSD